ncbi:MAG: ParB/RepB/Spo0J family partition protein [Acidobacteriota bacterium]|nr:ParB/RepB/Spo0J family partition protein [Acidobacteriota bacterium]MDH3522846.1 ParB/RepB/Spo0J family partition protein [Acidobacteriota bacterium]
MDQPDKRRGLPARVKMRHDTHFIDELTQRHQEPVGLMVALSALEPDGAQPRTVMGDLDDLVGSISERGILEPILVRPIPAPSLDGPEYRIISGERRFRAAQQAGLDEVPVIVFEVDPDEALEIALIENLQRKDLTPFEEAAGFRALAERHGYTHQEVASAVGRSRSLVTETLKLLEMPPAVREAAEELGVASRSLLLGIVRAAGGDEAGMLAMLEQAAEGQLNRDDVRREARSATRERAAARRKPYVFKFRAPDKTFKLSLSFRRSEVDRGDLIGALETILEELRTAEQAELGPIPQAPRPLPAAGSESVRTEPDVEEE